MNLMQKYILILKEALEKMQKHALELAGKMWDDSINEVIKDYPWLENEYENENKDYLKKYFVAGFGCGFYHLTENLIQFRKTDIENDELDAIAAVKLQTVAAEEGKLENINEFVLDAFQIAYIKGYRIAQEKIKNIADIVELFGV